MFFILYLLVDDGVYYFTVCQSTWDDACVASMFVCIKFMWTTVVWLPSVHRLRSVSQTAKLYTKENR